MAARRNVGGFTLLEAIVALVIFTTGAFVLFGWLSSSVIAMQRVAERRDANEAVASALELVQGVNPMLEARGSREVGALEVRWQATPVLPPRTSITQVGRPTVFEAGLYILDVQVLQGGREVDAFQVRQVGYRQARALESE